MVNSRPISFGDNVRVLSSDITIQKGLVGLTGQVYGETTPSCTGVEVIGELKSDYAINVHFEERNESLWFAPELLEFVNHAPGTVITLKGVPKKWTRTESGEWQEEAIGNTREKAKPWWKFW